MPTGFTAAIADGIAFKEFALRCAGAFGDLMAMADDPMHARIPDHFQASNYHRERVSEARSRQKELESMTPVAAEEAAELAYREAVETRNGYIRDKADLRRKYEAMLSQVRAWQPPTTEHRCLKEFMENQIIQSIDLDCVLFGERPRLKQGVEWLAEQVHQVEHSIAYHSKHHAAEVERTERATEWVRQLRNSLS
jgi:hypothetical protein